MTQEDKLFFEWERKTFPEPNKVSWTERKEAYANYLVDTRTKNQIWKMLCGPATGPCDCNCLCAPGIAWNKLIERSLVEVGR